MRRRRVPHTIWVCPCEKWQLEAPFDHDLLDIEAVLMEHFTDCAVAQADVIARQAVNGA